MFPIFNMKGRMIKLTNDKFIIPTTIVTAIILIFFIILDDPPLNSAFLNKKKPISIFFCSSIISFLVLSFITKFFVEDVTDSVSGNNFVFICLIFLSFTVSSGIYILLNSYDLNSDLDIYFQNNLNLKKLLERYKKFTLKSKSLSTCLSYHDGSYFENSNLTCIKETNYTNQNSKSSLCNAEKAAKISDFYLISSNQSCLVPYTFGNYVSNRMLEITIEAGARFLDFDIYTEFYKNKAVPVVKSEFAKKPSKNFVTLHSCFKTIKEKAFKRNFDDPIFIHLNLKTNNLETLDRIAYSYLEVFTSENMPNPGMSYKNKQSIIQEPICKFFKKVMIVVTGKSENTLLDQITHFHTNFNAKIINEVEADFPSDPNKLVFETRKFFTIVKPDTNQNINPSRPWSHGCQCVLMNFWNLDIQMKKHAKFFHNSSFHIKSFDLQENRNDKSNERHILPKSINYSDVEINTSL